MPRSDEVRHVSWLELFFDVVTVAAIRQIADHLWHPVQESTFGLLAAYLAVWCVWTALTLLVNARSDRGRRKVFTFITMIGVGVIGASIPYGNHEIPLAISLVIVRFIIAISWWYTWYPTQHLRSIGLSVLCVVPWLTAATLPDPGRYIGFTIAVLIDFGITCSPHQLHSGKFFNAHHLRERLGTFVIIALGEVAVQMIEAAATTTWSLSLVIAGVCGFVTVTALWYIILDTLVGVSAVPSQTHTAPLLPTLAAHLAMTAGLVTLASGLGGLLNSSDEITATQRVTMLLTSSITLILVAELAFRDRFEPLALRLGIGIFPAIIAILGIGASGWSLTSTTWAITMTCAVGWRAGTRYLIRRYFIGHHPPLPTIRMIGTPASRGSFISSDVDEFALRQPLKDTRPGRHRRPSPNKPHHRV